MALVSTVVLGTGCGGNNSGSGGSGGIRITDARVDSAGTGGSGGMVDAAPPACDPSSPTGDVCTGTNPKCAITFPDPMAGAMIVCEMSMGSQATGQSCTRPGAMVAGEDTCAPGNYCSAIGVATSPGRVCRRICTATGASVCGTGTACFELSDPYGACRPTGCNGGDVFSTSNSCPTNTVGFPAPGTQTCQWALLAGRTASAALCTQGGSAGNGAACNPSANPPVECGPSLICLGDNKCHKFCDTSGSHGCAANEICQGALYSNPDDPNAPILAPGPMGGGWCVARPDGGTLVLLRPIYAVRRVLP
jgi:hypothetical protein